MDDDTLPTGSAVGIIAGALGAVALLGTCCWWLMVGRFLRGQQDAKAAVPRVPFVSLVPLALRIESEVYGAGERV